MDGWVESLVAGRGRQEFALIYGIPIPILPSVRCSGVEGSPRSLGGPDSEMPARSKRNHESYEHNYLIV